jgi:hypothetical protein
MDQEYTTVDDDASRAELAAWVDKMQQHNRQALAQLRPDELARFETWLRTRTSTTPPVRPPSRPVNGRAPRPAANARRRGSRRGQRAASSSSDDPDGEPEPLLAGGLTFERYHRLTALLPPHWRCRLFHRLPRRLQDQAWDALAAELERSRR